MIYSKLFYWAIWQAKAMFRKNLQPAILQSRHRNG